MNSSIAIQILPNCKESKTIEIIDEVISYIKSTGVNCQVSPFETVIEGEYEELIAILKECQYIAVKAGAESVFTNVKIDYTPNGKLLTIEEKVEKHK